MPPVNPIRSETDSSHWRGDATGSSHCDLRFVQNHRRLRVWRKAHDLAIEVRRATRLFPRSGYGSLQSQTTRAAESIALTIVEGCGASTRKEFARYLDVSIKSTTELEEELELARDYGILKPMAWEALTAAAIDVRRMLCGLRAKVLASTERELHAGREHRTGQRPHGKRTDLDSPGGFPERSSGEQP